MMNIHPGVLGVGAGVAAGLAVGIGATRITDGMAERNPTGSTADAGARNVFLATGAAGFGSVAGGMIALSSGNIGVGAALVGGGMGAFIGSIAAGNTFVGRHGAGVDTIVSGVMNEYDWNDDDALDMRSDSWWRGSELIRTVTEDNDEWMDDTDVYSIERLARAADADGNESATRAELRTVVDGYDLDGNDRLSGDELKSFRPDRG